MHTTHRRLSQLTVLLSYGLIALVSTGIAAAQDKVDTGSACLDSTGSSHIVIRWFTEDTSRINNCVDQWILDDKGRIGYVTHADFRILSEKCVGYQTRSTFSYMPINALVYCTLVQEVVNKLRQYPSSYDRVDGERVIRFVNLETWETRSVHFPDTHVRRYGEKDLTTDYNDLNILFDRLLDDQKLHSPVPIPRSSTPEPELESGD